MFYISKMHLSNFLVKQSRSFNFISEETVTFRTAENSDLLFLQNNTEMENNTISIKANKILFN